MKKQLSVISYQLSVIRKGLIRLVLFLLVTVHWSLFTVLTGCQQGSTPSQPQPQAPVSQVKKEPPKPEVASPVVETKKEEKKEETAVEVKQRNPFKPFITKATERVTVIVPKTPLQKYDVEQLKLVAIIWGVDNPMAMVEAPDGKGYRIKKGNLIGNKDGRVKRIEKDKIVIEEKFAEPGGEIKTNEFEIKLPLSKGEEELQ